MADWYRLELSACDPSLAPGLEARLADPLWLLARQWQLGELRGEDAGRPQQVKLSYELATPSSLRLGSGEAEPLAATVAGLEPRVQAEAAGGARRSAEAGLALVSLLRAAGFPKLADRLRHDFPIAATVDDELGVRSAATSAFLLGRAPDGAALVAVLSHALPTAWEDHPRLRALTDEWLAVWRDAFPPPGDPPAWRPAALGYQFSLATATGDGELILRASRHGGGRISWCDLDAGGKSHELPTAPLQLLTAERDAAPAAYPGMPAARYWELEDARVHLGELGAAPYDLGRVALAELATIHGDDWHLVPLTLPAGTLARLRSLQVTDSFGRTHDIKSSAVLDGADRQFRFAELSGDPGPEAGRAPWLCVWPAAPSLQEGDPIEELVLAHDEVGNLVWGVEQIVESPTGELVDRAAASRRAVQPAEARPTYAPLPALPAHAFPFVPVREDGVVLLVRGRSSSDQAAPRGRLLVPDRPLHIPAREVLQPGRKLTRRFRRIRLTDGSVQLWVGRRRSVRGDSGGQPAPFDEVLP